MIPHNERICWRWCSAITLVVAFGLIVWTSVSIQTKKNYRVYDGPFPPDDLNYTKLDNMECFYHQADLWYSGNTSKACLDASLQCYNGCYRRVILGTRRSCSRCGDEKYISGSEVVCGTYSDYVDNTRKTFMFTPWMYDSVKDNQVVCEDKDYSYYICGYKWDKTVADKCVGEKCQTIYLASKQCNKGYPHENDGGFILGLVVGIILMIISSVGLMLTCY
jgi:hypothetical protein